MNQRHRGDGDGNVRALPKPDPLPRFLRRLRQLAPQLLPNTPESLEAGMEAWNGLDVGDASYIDVMVAAQGVEGLGEILAELRTLNKGVARLVVLGRQLLDLGDELVDREPEREDDRFGEPDDEEPAVEPEVVTEPEPEAEPRRQVGPEATRKKKDDVPPGGES